MSMSSSSESPPVETAVSADTNGSKDEAGHDAESRPPPKKRRRTVISCTECHRRKQKCDRKLPCTNCLGRNKQGACTYETGAPTAKAHRSNTNNGAPISPEAEDPQDSIPSKVVNFGYSYTGPSTLGFLAKIEGAHPDEPLSALNPTSGQQDDLFNTRERYKSLIRQLPARSYIEKLGDIYFKGFNWHYYGLERDIFEKQLTDWYKLPFSLLTSGGPQALPPDLRVFPGLVFQVLAMALLVLTPGDDHLFESLKYAGNMSFEDLAVDYSESGVAILSLLGKRQMTLTTVMAGFVRASFLKYVAQVTEAWHAIGGAIRDAQEIGLHRDSLDPKPRSDDAESVLENQWEIQRRRRLWMILIGWDVHTGLILGRPITISLGMTPPTLPIDAPIPKDRSKTPVLPRGENDSPTPLTRSLWAHEIMLPLREVLELEKEGPCPKDFGRVDRLHQELLDLDARTPSWFRMVNPDTRFDSLPECHWLPYVRTTLPQLMAFNFMALHRPYIFTRPESRTEALRASLRMLHAQKAHFKSLPPQQHRAHSLFFGTFDAIVMIASIYILFPKEHPDLVFESIQQFDWSVERFEIMSVRNGLAKAALGVLRAINLRLRRSLGISSQPGTSAKSILPSPASTTPSASVGDQNNGPSPYSSYWETSILPSGANPETATTSSASPQPGSSSTFTNGSNIFSPSVAVGGGVYSTGSSSNDGADGGAAVTAAVTAATADFDWGTLPSGFDLASLQPIYATSDLIYNDLMTMGDDSSPSGVAVHSSSTPLAGAWDGSDMGAAALPWQFEGDFGNDSVWNLFNQYKSF
ncbi:fungal-specific transcription factor domain-containing protein [Lasiosphaeria ovina]|uniref:Fungal-specific transcription factor domain-containing protein n=1 Tax=Lasiosphaeria ovina TaxID=92902 RepID=A0AAE0K8X0_9PEZI|nr:fungal-specific transcription factor domain-containing protein [Lasiosphaeria ovina]